MDRETNPYADIIRLPHHKAANRPHMSMYDRAAQFSPFAALTGHDAAIRETARVTEQRIILDESEKNILDEGLKIIASNIGNKPEISLVYFREDELKDGGSYEEIADIVVKIDYYGRVIVMKSGISVNFDDIYKIDGDMLQKVYNEYV